ncbi:MAG: hypothetical protein HYT89_00970 [Candidatus Omnitrophica bacterium]|nr:hypothetical protein [Candidatus Omnitrophota bacterium]
MTLGVKFFGLCKEMSFEPKYRFYRYHPNEDVEAGGYDAHILWLNVTTRWS